MKPRRLVRFAPVLVGLLLTASGAHAQATLPSPEQFFGFQMGADRKLANWDKLHEYYQLLAKTLEQGAGSSSSARPAKGVPTSRSSSRRPPISRSSITTSR